MALSPFQAMQLGLGDDPAKPAIPPVRPDATAVKAPDPVEDKLRARDKETLHHLALVARAIYGDRGGVLPSKPGPEQTPGYISAPLGGELDNAFASGAQREKDPERAAQIDQMFSNAQPVDQKASANHAALAAYLKNRRPK